MEKHIQISALILYVIIIVLNLIYYYKKVRKHQWIFIFGMIIPGINLLLLISVMIYWWWDNHTFKRMQISEKQRRTPTE